MSKTSTNKYPAMFVELARENPVAGTKQTWIMRK